MGFDATSGEENTTGHAIQTQALSFAGSTAKPQKPQKLDEPACNSRSGLPVPNCYETGNRRLLPSPS